MRSASQGEHGMTWGFDWARRNLARACLTLGLFGLAACGDISLPASVADSGQTIDPTKPVQVALLLPRGSGQAGDEVLAKSLENAARLAISDLDGVTVDLRVYATAGNPATAATVAVQAVNEGAKIILGPVYGAAANAAGAAVAGQNVNIMAFSNNTDIAGGNVFVLGHTFENTADRLVQYAVGQGKTKIMIVSAQDQAEDKGRASIAAAMSRNGATQAGSTSFELSQDGVVKAVPTITNSAQTNGAEALFFTSGTAGALPILTQLIVENGLDPSITQFIGLQRWDIPANALELPPLQGGWFALPAPGPSSEFRNRYRATYSDSPHTIAGLAYDGIAAIGALVKAGKSNALTVSGLTQATGFAGVNGIFRLRTDGTIERGLAIATIRDNKLVVIEPAPRSFGGAGF